MSDNSWNSALHTWVYIYFLKCYSIFHFFANTFFLLLTPPNLLLISWSPIFWEGGGGWSYLISRVFFVVYLIFWVDSLIPLKVVATLRIPFNCFMPILKFQFCILNNYYDNNNNNNWNLCSAISIHKIFKSAAHCHSLSHSQQRHNGRAWKGVFWDTSWRPDTMYNPSGVKEAHSIINIYINISL